MTLSTVSLIICFFTTFLALAEAPLYDLKEHHGYTYYARGRTGLQVVNSTLKLNVTIPVKTFGISIAFGRLYVAQGSHGVRAFNLEDINHYRSGQSIQLLERIKGVHAFGIAIDAARQLLYLSGNQKQTGEGSGNGVTYWHFPDPRRAKATVGPLNPIGFYPVLGAGALSYQNSSGILFMTNGSRGVGSMRVSFDNDGNEKAVYFGNVLPISGDLKWQGLDVDRQGKMTFSRSLSSGENHIFQWDTSSYFNTLKQNMRVIKLSQQKELQRTSTKWKIFASKFGQGFFSAFPILNRFYTGGESLYMSEINDLHEEGQIGTKDYNNLKSSVRRLEIASQATGVTGSIALYLYGVGELAALHTGITAATAGGAGVKGLLMAAAKIGLNKENLLVTAIDVTVSNAILLVYEKLLHRTKKEIIRDIAFNTLSSATISFAGLSPQIASGRKAALMLENNVISTAIVANIDGLSGSETDKYMAFNIGFTLIPFTSSLKRYDLQTKAVEKLTPLYSSKMMELIKSPKLKRILLNEKVLSLTVGASVGVVNQSYSNFAYVGGDKFINYLYNLGNPDVVSSKPLNGAMRAIIR